MTELEYTPTNKNEKAFKEENRGISIDNLSIGDFLFNQYEIIQIIKKGGMGVIYVTQDKENSWKYAVKTYNTTNFNKNQFETEINLLIEIPPHENIVQTDFIKYLNNKPFIFMEYIDGTDLYQKIQKQKLIFSDAIEYALQICEGMKFIHEKGHVLHLDIKPENILINNEGMVKIADFGISKPSLLLSRIKTVQKAGTYLYMSPEQMKGETVDIFSDIYSFGVLFYDMLTGKLPYPFDIYAFRNDNKMLKQKLLEFHNSEFDFHDELSRKEISGRAEIDNLVRHCLAKYPSSRKIAGFDFIKRWIKSSLNISEENQYKSKNIDIDFHRKAVNLQTIGKHSRALEYFNSALKNDPLNLKIWNEASNSFVALCMDKEATYLHEIANNIGGNYECS